MPPQVQPVSFTAGQGIGAQIDPFSPLQQLQLDPRRALAARLLTSLPQQQADTPQQAIGQGLSGIGQTLAGALLSRRLTNEAQQQQQATAQAYQSGVTAADALGPQASQSQRLSAMLQAWGQNPQLAPLAAQMIAQRTAQGAAAEDPVAPPPGFQRGPNGGLLPIPGGPADPSYMSQAYAGQHPITMAGETPYATGALLGGQPGPQQAPQGPPQGQPQQGAALGPNGPVLAQIRQGESGGNPNAVARDPRTGQPIATGLYQFTDATWQGVASRHPELNLTPAGITDPQQQERAAQAHAQDILRDLGQYIGRPGPNGQPITPEMLIRGAWLGGIAGMQRHIESGGQYNPADVFGTRLGDYAAGTARNLRPMQPQQAAAPGPSRLQGQPVPGQLPVGQDAPPGSMPVPMAGGPQQQQVAQAPGASDAGPVPDVQSQLPDSRGGQPRVALPPVDPQSLVLRRQPGQLTSAPSNQQISQAREARSQFFTQPEVRNALRVGTVLNSMEDAQGRGTAASDLNLIYGLMTILDPGSVVREGETTMVRQTQSIPDWLMGTYQRLSSGGAALQTEDRTRIMDEARSRARAQLDTYGDIWDSEAGFLRSANLNPDAVLGRRMSLPTPRPAPQQPQGGGQGGGQGTPPPGTTTGQAAPGGAPTPQRAINPQTGEIRELRNGQWVPVQGQ